jgi:UDP-N-acetylglucosamine 4,6-dehydratase
LSIDNKRILITGGAGSFGSAFCNFIKQSTIRPEKIIILSRDPLKHQALKSQLGDMPCPVNYIIRDIRDRDGLIMAFEGIDIIIHAAAMKHIVECEYDTRETIMTNIMGTQNVVDAAIKCGVQKVILISTDKACQAVNTYGISKAMAEKIFINGNVLARKKNTRFSVCRYGNVINSNGSVLPLFKKLIDNGAKELPITHLDMTRYFYRMDDAIKLVLNSLDLMQGGETYIPKIPSIRLTDLVAAFNMPYTITGIRPGEKLHECMIPEEMAHLTRDYGEYFIIKPTHIFTDTIDYDKDGILVPERFKYDSRTNPDFFSIEQIKNLI